MTNVINKSFILVSILSIFILSGCGKKFESSDECFNFIRQNSGNMDKMKVGGASCYLLFNSSGQDEDSITRKNTGQCILNNFSEITDDTSGTRVVTKCAESNKSSQLGAMLSANFSQAQRIQKKLDEAREEQRLQQRQQQEQMQNLQEQQEQILEQQRQQQIFDSINESNRFLNSLVK